MGEVWIIKSTNNDLKLLNQNKNIISKDKVVDKKALLNYLYSIKKMSSTQSAMVIVDSQIYKEIEKFQDYNLNEKIEKPESFNRYKSFYINNTEIFAQKIKEEFMKDDKTKFNELIEKLVLGMEDIDFCKIPISTTSLSKGKIDNVVFVKHSDDYTFIEEHKELIPDEIKFEMTIQGNTIFHKINSMDTNLGKGSKNIVLLIYVPEVLSAMVAFSENNLNLYLTKINLISIVRHLEIILHLADKNKDQIPESIIEAEETIQYKKGAFVAAVTPELKPKIRAIELVVSGILTSIKNLFLLFNKKNNPERLLSFAPKFPGNKNCQFLFLVDNIMITGTLKTNLQDINYKFFKYNNDIVDQRIIDDNNLNTGFIFTK